MEALILTCGTGGGHSAAAEAVREELECRGHAATVLNPYTLRGGRRAKQIDNAYISLVQTVPRMFGFIYALGELYRQLPWRSPVYFLNRKAAERLGQYLRKHPADVVIATHIFPAEILAQMKVLDMAPPKTIFIATDYTCIPFTEETDCDAYVIPAQDLAEDYRRRGIAREKLFPLGIPVRRAFTCPPSQEDARKALGLDPDKRYLLIAGGSIGAGGLKRTLRRFYRQRGADTEIIVICGHNRKLYQKLNRKYGREITVLQHTDRMALYLRACDLYLTKPGGLCSTEAAVMGVHLIHFPPIPGCETKNAHFFHAHGMSLRFGGKRWEATEILSRMDDGALWSTITAHQRETIPANAAAGIRALAEEMARAAHCGRVGPT